MLTKILFIFCFVELFFFSTFAPMKTKKKNNVVSELTQEEAFRQKVGHYLVCFTDQCPLHDQCLRWLVGQYADTRPLAIWNGASAIALYPSSDAGSISRCEGETVLLPRSSSRTSLRFVDNMVGRV